MQIGTRQKLNQVKFISHKVVRAFGEYDIGACAALRVKTLCMWFDNKLLRATKGAAILISSLLLRMRRMYVASIRLDFH